MSLLLNSVILLILSSIVIFIIKKIKNIYQQSKLFKYLKISLKINFIDYQDDNYFNEINIKVKENNPINMPINTNTLFIPIFEFKNQQILDCEITIKNSSTNANRKFKISIYKEFVNNINIYLNNHANKFYSSEIIFYGKINEISLNNNLISDKFNLEKRLRCVILNIEEIALFKIIKDNNKYNKQLNSKILSALSNYANQNLLINIFIGNNKSNLVIFYEEEQKIITATVEEKKLISEFYRKIIRNINNDRDNDINQLCESFIKSLLSNKILFGTIIEETNNDNLYKIIFSYINQGVNYLFSNNILNEKDKDFIYGCLILLLYNSKNINSMDYDIIITINNIINKMKKNKFNIIDQIKAVITFVSFYINKNYSYTLKITNKLDDNSTYKKAFNYYESIINDLSEESDLMLIFLQLNSGCGLEILNNKSCYKISMLSIKDTKEHLKDNIPKYFFCYNIKNGDIAISDPKTQIIGFNEGEIFKKKNKKLSEEEINNNIMNVLICMFHEGGHQKFHMNIKERGKYEPILFITKNFGLESHECLNMGDDKTGESGICVDLYLYSFKLYPAQILSRSSESYKLFKKEYFTGNLDELNKISLKIIKEYLERNNIFPKTQDDIDTLKNIINLLNKQNNDSFSDDDYIINK